MDEVKLFYRDRGFLVFGALAIPLGMTSEATNYIFLLSPANFMIAYAVCKNVT